MSADVEHFRRRLDHARGRGIGVLYVVMRSNSSSRRTPFDLAAAILRRGRDRFGAVRIAFGSDAMRPLRRRAVRHKAQAT